MRRLLDLPLGNVKHDVKHPWAELHSVRPVLVVTDDKSSDAANAHAEERRRAGSPYAVYSPSTAPGGGAETGGCSIFSGGGESSAEPDLI